MVLLLLLLLLLKREIKRIKVLVAPASGSPKVDQGLVKGLKWVSKRCRQAHSQSSNVVKQSKDKNQSIANKSMFISQETTHTRTVQPEELAQQSLEEKPKCYF